MYSVKNQIHKHENFEPTLAKNEAALRFSRRAASASLQTLKPLPKVSRNADDIGVIVLAKKIDKTRESLGKHYSCGRVGDHR